MSWFLVLLILLFLGGIILLGVKSPFEKKTREQFLQELAGFLEGTFESLGDEVYGRSFRLLFRFGGEEFIFEDLEKQGFRDKVYVAYLKVKTPSKLTLTFTEKRRSMRIRTDIFMASEISTQQAEDHVLLQVPKYLKDLKVSTNDPVVANKLFEDKKAAAVFRQFKNVDSRGYPFLSIGIVDGTVILEFHSVKAFNPSLSNLWADIASIEDYLDKNEFLNGTTFFLFSCL